jgi:hypothetical protein
MRSFPRTGNFGLFKRLPQRLRPRARQKYVGARVLGMYAIRRGQEQSIPS